MRRRSSLSLLALLLATGCAVSADKRLMANSASLYLYFEQGVYEPGCVAKAARPDCAAFQTDLIAAKAALVLATKVVAIGPMPKEETAEIRAKIASLRAHKP